MSSVSRQTSCPVTITREAISKDEQESFLKQFVSDDIGIVCVSAAESCETADTLLTHIDQKLISLSDGTSSPSSSSFTQIDHLVIRSEVIVITCESSESSLSFMLVRMHHPASEPVSQNIAVHVVRTSITTPDVLIDFLNHLGSESKFITETGYSLTQNTPLPDQLCLIRDWFRDRVRHNEERMCSIHSGDIFSLNHEDDLTKDFIPDLVLYMLTFSSKDQVPSHQLTSRRISHVFTSVRVREPTVNSLIEEYVNTMKRLMIESQDDKSFSLNSAHVRISAEAHMKLKESNVVTGYRIMELDRLLKLKFQQLISGNEGILESRKNYYVTKITREYMVRMKEVMRSLITTEELKQSHDDIVTECIDQIRSQSCNGDRELHSFIMEAYELIKEINSEETESLTSSLSYLLMDHVSDIESSVRDLMQSSPSVITSQEEFYHKLQEMKQNLMEEFDSCLKSQPKFKQMSQQFLVELRGDFEEKADDLVKTVMQSEIQDREDRISDHMERVNQLALMQQDVSKFMEEMEMLFMDQMEPLITQELPVMNDLQEKCKQLKQQHVNTWMFDETRDKLKDILDHEINFMMKRLGDILNELSDDSDYECSSRVRRESDSLMTDDEGEEDGQQQEKAAASRRGVLLSAVHNVSSVCRNIVNYLTGRIRNPGD